MNDNPYQSPKQQPADRETRNALVASYIESLGCGLLLLAALMLALVGLVLASPVLNDEPTWPVEVRIVPPAIGFLMSGICCVVSARRHRSGKPWAAWCGAAFAIVISLIVACVL